MNAAMREAFRGDIGCGRPQNHTTMTDENWTGCNECLDLALKAAVATQSPPSKPDDASLRLLGLQVKLDERVPRNEIWLAKHDEATDQLRAIVKLFNHSRGAQP